MNPNKALWEKGDFTRIAEGMRESGEALVAQLGIIRGMDVLDLGCGDGTTAIPEAKLGANVLGIDIASRHRQSDGFFIGSGYNSQSNSKSTQLSPKVTYTDRLGAGALTVVAGVDLNNWNYNAADNFGQNERAKQTNRAAFISTDFLLPTGTRLNLGARQERVNKQGQDPLNFVSYDRSNSLRAWDIGVNQALALGLNAYGRAAQAYRLPVVDAAQGVCPPEHGA